MVTADSTDTTTVAVRPVHRVTYEIKPNADGPTDRDFEAVATRYADNQFRKDVPTSAFTWLFALFGLHTRPEKRRRKR